MSRLRVTYANVISTLCLFLLLAGGAAYAANQLAKNSVGTKQLKKNAVNGSKVKDQSLTGSDINLAKLGTVPSATNAANATTAGTASALTPLEAIHLVGAPGEPAFQGGSSNLPGEAPNQFAPVGFYKDHEGIVHLEGVIKTGAEGKLFVLPPGFRPPNNVIQEFQPGKISLIIVGSNVNVAGITFDGEILDPGTAPGETAALSGITFRAGS